MKFSLNNISILIFVLFIISGSIPLKIIGVSLYLIISPSKVVFKLNHRISLFYVLLILLTILLGLPYILQKNYIYGLVISLMDLSISLLTFIIIYFHINNTTFEKNRALLDNVFYIIVGYSFFQYLLMIIKFGSLNIYSNSAASGDLLTSIFSNSSVNMIVMSFFLLYYGFNKDFKKAVLSVIVILMTGYMSGIVLMIASVGIWYFTTLKYSKLHLTIGFVAVSVVLIFPLISPGNYYYVINYLKQSISSNPPYKIVSYFETLKYWTSSVTSFFIGAGPLNFSSRTAFVISGDYVKWYPSDLIYISEDFYNNHFGIWIHDFMNSYNNRNNMANQPFSFYNRLIGEFGLLGLLSYSLTYFYFLLKHSLSDSLIKLMTIFFTLLLFTDYWFEYLSVVIVFEMLILTRINDNSVNT